MPSLGDFTPEQTTDTTADPDTFVYFGDVFEIPQSVGAGALLRFTFEIHTSETEHDRADAIRRTARTEERLDDAREVATRASMRVQAAVYLMLQSVFGKHQLPRLLDVVDSNGVDQEGLMALCGRVQAVIAGRPTKRSADSSAGPSKSGDTSTAVGSSSMVIAGSTVPAKPVPQRPSPGTSTSAPAGETPLVMSPRDQQMAEIAAAGIPVP